MNTTIFILPIVSFEWTTDDERLFQHISSERQNKIHKYYFSSDKRHSLYAALLTRMEICSILKQPVPNLIFNRDKNQKPYLKNYENFHFNISHTEGAVLLGISPRPIGVDIESNCNPPLEIMSHFFHKDEVYYVNTALSEEARKTRFFHVWTQKEALTKYSGSGLITDLKELNTQNVSLQPDFTTWSYESFICSVYSKIPLKEKPIIVTETDITDFFLHKQQRVGF